MFLTCCCCTERPADEQYWPPLHNILKQNRKVPAHRSGSKHQCFQTGLVSYIRNYNHLQEGDESAHLNLGLSFNNTGFWHWHRGRNSMDFFSKAKCLTEQQQEEKSSMYLLLHSTTDHCRTWFLPASANMCYWLCQHSVK